MARAFTASLRPGKASSGSGHGRCRRSERRLSLPDPEMRRTTPQVGQLPPMLTVGHGASVATSHEELCPIRAPRRVTVSGQTRSFDGELAAKISTTVVRALARTTGRGPTKARTTLGDNGIFVVLQDSLTRGEQTLADAGEGVAVLDLRRRWQRVMQADVSREIEQLTGRKVIGFMSDNHIDPDLAVEVFVLEPLPPAAH
jgi:uncharacterized protein YbcI